jgi:hypothetical protein
VDVKSFIAGGICGAALLALVTAVVDVSPDNGGHKKNGSVEIAPPSPRPSSPSAQLSEDDPGESERDPGDSKRDPDENAGVSEARSREQLESQVPEPSIVSAVSAPATSVQSPSQQRGRDSSPDDEGTQLLDPSLAANEWYGRHKEELLEEPKDDAWAYTMELAIEQFLANHPDFPKFSIDYIECRSTLCQIAVAGYDESTNSDWSGVLYDMRVQSWYEFGQTGTGGSVVDGRYVLISKLYRRPEGAP